jgi:hypothetical protein
MNSNINNQVQHPEIDNFTVVLRQELMEDVRLIGRIRDLESKYNRYEAIMRRVYNSENEWPAFDEFSNYY